MNLSPVGSNSTEGSAGDSQCQTCDKNGPAGPRRHKTATTSPPTDLRATRGRRRAERARSEAPSPEVWTVRCPRSGCPGRIRAERGRSVEWIYVCDRHGRAFGDLAEGYGASTAALYEVGPLGTPQIPWQRHRALKLAPEPNPEMAQHAIWQRKLWRNRRALAYLRDERGLSDETIESFGIGYGRPNDRRPSGFVLPQPISDGEPTSYRLRFWPELWRCGSRNVKIASPRHHRAQVYPRLPSPAERAAGVVVEGEFDALLLRQHGFNAYSVPGIMVKPGLARQLGARLEKVAVAFDVGSNARAAADRLVGLLAAAGADAWRVDLPMPRDGDDATDWFQTYGRSADELRDVLNATYHERGV